MLSDHPVDVMLLATDPAWPAGSTATQLAWRCCCPMSSSSPSGVAVTAGWWSPRASPGPPIRRPRHAGAWTTWPTRSPSCGHAASRSRSSPSWGPWTGSPTSGFALASWFTDPHGNSIGLLQLK